VSVAVLMPLDLARQTVIRWTEPDPSHVELLKRAGIEGVILTSPNVTFEQACSAAGIATASESELRDAVKGGLWPGIRSGPNVKGRGDETASASREPWVDANGWLVAYHRALQPSRTPVLAYVPDKAAGLEPTRSVPFETLELALIEARIGGGNYVLALEPRYRAALLQRETKALEAWDSLGRTAAWLRTNAPLFGLPVIPAATILVDSGDATAELANLAYRRNASPALTSAANLPAPDPNRILCVSAASIERREPAILRRVLAHATAGATVVTDYPPDASWGRLKEIKKEQDRTFYALGRGQVVVYQSAVADPSEFALDLIDFVQHRRRPARLWNALSTIPLATAGPKRGEALLHVINYGSQRDEEVQARIQGHYSRAMLLSPGKPPQQLQAARRGSMTEVFLPGISQLAVVHFNQQTG
jgi:hypothetical protein